MNQSFEVLPFGGQSAEQGAWGQEREAQYPAQYQGEYGAEYEDEWGGEMEWLGEEEGEWQGERARPYGPGQRGSLRARPPLRGPRRPAPPRYQGRRPGRRPAEPLPYLPPRYRGWGVYPGGYGGLYPAPYPVAGPDADARDEPDQTGTDGQDGGQDGMQDEAPPTLAATLGRVPAAAALRYQALGPIAAAVRHPAGTGPGLYLIEFDANGRRRAYSGQTDNLRRRLLQHRLCGQILAIDMRNHQVYVAPLSSSAQRRDIERAIHDDMFATQRGVLTNQRRELEVAALGELWN